jgi:hypothetical protein
MGKTMCHPVDHGGRELKQASLQGAAGTNLNRDAAVVRKRIGQHFKFFPVYADLLGNGVSEFLNLGAHFRGRKTARAGVHRTSLPKTAIKSGNFNKGRVLLP